LEGGLGPWKLNRTPTECGVLTLRVPRRASTWLAELVRATEESP
jgi:hypothetical protein